MKKHTYKNRQILYGYRNLRELSERALRNLDKSIDNAQDVAVMRYVLLQFLNWFKTDFKELPLFAKAAHEELSKGYTNVCNANIAQGRETDNLRNELAKLRSENADLKQERRTLIDLLEEKGFTLVKNTECPHDMVETGDPFCKENPETVRVDSCACWNCEYFCLRLKDRGKIVCKEGQKRNQQDNNADVAIV